MQRPVMDPLFLLHDPEAEKAGKRFRVPWHLLWRTLRGLRWCLAKLLSSPLRWRAAARAATDRDGLAARFVRGALYRLLFAPSLIALAVTVLVFCGTHPLPGSPGGDPSSRGVYFDPVSFCGEDGTPLQGWLVPAVDARRVLEQKDRLLRARHPAVVLAHDFGRSPSQLLPLLAPLHEEGFEVLVVGLRGVGSILPSGQTFGLNESKDVEAAVRFLRGRASVDVKRVAVLGVGTGANAALLAGERDAAIGTLVLADPVGDAREAVARYVGPDRWPLRWMQPLCKWGFEIGYRVDADEIRLGNFQKAMDSAGTFCAEGAVAEDGTLAPEFVRLAAEFCRARLRPDQTPEEKVKAPGMAKAE